MKDENSYSYSWLAAALDEAGTGFWVAQQGIGAMHPSTPSLDIVGQTAAAAAIPATRSMTLAKMQH